MRTFLLLFCLPFLGSACSDDPAPQRRKPADPWSNQEEVLFQTQEVIRYLDEQQRLHREQMDALNLTPRTGGPMGRALPTAN